MFIDTPKISWAGSKHLPGFLVGRGSLTSIVLLLGVFDVGRELGEDVNTCSVGLSVFCSQFGVPGREDPVL
jgi:hypothetical protein